MTRDELRIAAVIPARMESVRFQGKPLHPFRGVPMVEHVRRRAVLCSEFDDVVVATCDREIREAVKASGGRSVMTSSDHPTGTDRVAEAVEDVDCTHVVILQGDEPLVLPEWLGRFAAALRKRPRSRAWNAVAALESEDELDDRSVVKCAVARDGRILLCFRRSPCLSRFEEQRGFIRKILGVIGFRKDFLREFTELAPTPFEAAESVEQSRILEHGHALLSVEWPVGYPSVNHPSDVELVEKVMSEDPRQREILRTVVEEAAPAARGGEGR